MEKNLENYLKALGMNEDTIKSFLKQLSTEATMVTVSNSQSNWEQSSIPKEQLGIPDTDYLYHITNPNTKVSVEVSKTSEFLNSLHQEIPSIITPSTNIEFINYGDTELVYVATNEQGRYTILVGQPITQLGVVKLEYDNLRHLAKKNPCLVVTPISYISNNSREAYITPYIHQARCIASYNQNYGAYIPEPYYRFEAYTKEDEHLITKVIIANLIRLYDEDEHLAIADCKIGGGDFIMEKEFDTIEHNEENALKHMKLIAARKLINIELKEYIKLLKEEFSKRTYYKSLQDRNPSILINIKNRVPMSNQAITEGIDLGLQLRKTQFK